MRPVLVFVALAIISVTQASAQSGAPSNARNRLDLYAKAIVRYADSASHALQLAQREKGWTSSADPEMTRFPSVLQAALGRAKRLTGDFDANVPPEDLQRLHTQIVTALQQVSDGLERMAGTLGRIDDCKARRAAGTGCDLLLTQARAMDQVQLDLMRVMAGYADYVEVRARAERMLSDRGATLPALAIR